MTNPDKLSASPVSFYAVRRITPSHVMQQWCHEALPAEVMRHRHNHDTTHAKDACEQLVPTSGGGIPLDVATERW